MIPSIITALSMLIVVGVIWICNLKATITRQASLLKNNEYTHNANINKINELSYELELRRAGVEVPEKKRTGGTSLMM